MDATRLPKWTVSQIRDQLSHLDAIDEALLHALEADTRTGVRNLALRERKRRKAEAAEQARLEAMLKLERTLWKRIYYEFSRSYRSSLRIVIGAS